jgi:hypothetical protein
MFIKKISESDRYAIVENGFVVAIFNTFREAFEYIKNL